MPRKRAAFSAKIRSPLTGKQFRVSAATRAQLASLVAFVDGLRVDLRMGHISEVDAARKLLTLRGRRPATLALAARSYLARPTLAPHTLRRTQSQLTTHLAELSRLSLWELTAPRLSRWIEELGTKLTTGTIEVVWRTLRAIIRHALERGMIERCPWGSWRPTGIKGKVSERAPREAARHVGELRSLIAAALALDPSGWRAVKIATAALLGLRQGELAGLRWRDVDFGEETVTIARQRNGPTKGRRVDVIAADGALFITLAGWRTTWESTYGVEARGDHPVFACPWRSSVGNPLPYIGRSEVLTAAELRAAVAAAGLPHPERWSPHSLRDTFVTLENEAAGGDLRVVMERSRHASLTSVARYLRARTRQLAPPRMQLGGLPAVLPAAGGKA
jgi:integrase